MAKAADLTKRYLDEAGIGYFGLPNGPISRFVPEKYFFRRVMRECINYQKKEGKVECRACFHFCKIAEGKTGLCGVRQNRSGKLFLLTYNKAIAVHIDPIEKKPLFHFLPGSYAYSLGTLGCNLRCANCQNFDISQMFGQKGKIENYAKLNWGLDLTPEQIVEKALENNCQSIAYTYNEPTIFWEYALDTMKLARKRGLKNVWVSNGFMSSQTLDAIIPYLDAINVDIKSFDDQFYKTNCGARLDPILENCRRLVKEKVWLEITTLIIPTLSDEERMLEKIACFIKEELGDFVPWHVSAFSGAISWKLKFLPDTPILKIKKASALGKEAGLKYVYAGNIWEENLVNTYCPQCDEVVIKRVGYVTERFDQNGKCPNCGKILEGVFN